MNWRVIYAYHGGEARSFRTTFRRARDMMRVFPDAKALEHIPTGLRISRRWLTRIPFRRMPL